MKRTTRKPTLVYVVTFYMLDGSTINERYTSYVYARARAAHMRNAQPWRRRPTVRRVETIWGGVVA